MLPAFVHQLLSKHIGNQVFCIYRDNGKVSLKNGALLHALTDKIIVKSTDGATTEINFFAGDQLQTLNIYNNNLIDLMRGKKPYSLDEKMKVKEIKTLIMQNLKRVMEKDVMIVYKLDNKIASIKGLFSNMGMVGISIKPGPFYNTEETLNYRNVLHIYNATGSDLLNVKIQ